MNEVELVVIGTFLNRIDAEVAQGALEAAAIESMISGDDAGGLRPGLGSGGTRLLVRRDDAERAGSILSESS
jgi:hypothetical protein